MKSNRLGLIPKDDQAQALRIRRFGMAAASYAMWVVLILFCYSRGLMNMSAGMLYGIILMLMAGNAIFYLVLRSGYNKRLKDPSLTMPQMVMGALFAVVVIFHAEAVRGVMLLIFLVVFTFGVFRLHVRQFLHLTVLVLASYGGSIIYLTHFHPGRINTEQEILSWVVLASILIWFSFIGGYINRLRSDGMRFNAELTQAMATIADLAIHDELTQVYNRRHVFTILQREKSLADRGMASFAVCMLDLDHFKQVNDTYGHMAGDAVLKTTAQAIQKNIRAADYLARYGGEEFILVLTYPDVEDGLKCAERICRFCAEQRFAGLPDAFRITISGGVTAYRPSESVDDLVKRADEALYYAKGNGRNRIEYL